MGFGVPLQTATVGKLCRTGAALVGLLATVHSPMDDQLTGRIESLVAFRTAKGSFIAVRPIVNRPRVVRPETLRTFGTAIRPLARVVPNVIFQVATFGKS